MRVTGLLLLAGLAGGALCWWWFGQRPAQPSPDDPRLSTGQSGVVMLAAEWCGYCRKQRADFDRAGVRYQVLDVETEAGYRASRALGARGVPVTVVGQSVIHGYDTAALDEKLTPLGYDVY